MDGTTPVYFDTHAHLTDKRFEKDIDSVIQRAKDAGVARVVNVGDGLASSRACVKMAQKHDMLLPAIGVHPHDARAYDDATEHALLQLAHDERVCAIGEIGLDYHYDFCPRDVQRKAFERQLRLAQRLDLPVIMHCREAYPDLIEILESYDNAKKGIAHCFSGSSKDAETLQQMGYFLGVAGPVTLPNADTLRAVVHQISLNRMLLETDSPYLAPTAKRGRRNEPAHIRFIANQVGLLKDLSGRDIGRVTSYNAHRALHLTAELEPRVAYQIRNSLYLNITNRCTNDCVFCRRRTDYMAVGHYLKLSHEPSVDDVIRAIGDPTAFDEVVFCGYGEPTIRLDAIKDVSAYLTPKGVHIRLDTNGQGNLIHGRDICDDLRGLIQSVSISLNAATQKDYNTLCQPQDPHKAYDAVLGFARKAKRHFRQVTLTAVNYPKVNIDACRRVADNLGLAFRLRGYSRFV